MALEEKTLKGSVYLNILDLAFTMTHLEVAKRAKIAISFTERTIHGTIQMRVMRQEVRLLEANEGEMMLHLVTHLF